VASILGDKFVWCVGIENTFIPQTRPGMRALDEYELMQHYQLWRTDFDLAAELGVSHIRWGVPWYRVNPAPGKFDWQWIDEALEYLVSRKGIQPIIDLMHYGTPFWLDNAFLNASYPERVAEYAYAFASRYKDLVRFYTPLNEPTVNAEFCGKRGEWPPYLQGDDGYVKLLIPIVRGTVLTARAIRDADADSVLIQVEALGKVRTADERLEPAVVDWTEDRFLGFDLLTGKFSATSHLYPFMQKHGVTDQDICWFQEHAVKPDVLGVNYYPVSGGELVMSPEGTMRLIMGDRASDLSEILQCAWERYHVPLMLTETGITAPLMTDRKRWMAETVKAVRQTISQGVPVLGYTWWPLFDMVDWAYRLGNRPLGSYIFKGGLWSCKPDKAGIITRHRNALADQYRQYITGQK
jgi:beta-glucosidase